jgi:hypothetical protein
MKYLISLCVLLGLPVMLGAQNPVPMVDQPLVPTSATPGGPGFTLTVNGSGFVSGSTVQWNGTPLATTFVSARRLAATVPATHITAPGAAEIAVSSPPPGGGNSSVAWFEISAPSTAPGLFSRTNYSTIDLGLSVYSGDFNGDGIPDLAEIAFDTVYISLGVGDGTFVSTTSYLTTGVVASYVTGGDFNGDGKPDLAISSFNCPTVPCNPGVVTIFLGNGDGTFQPPLTFETAQEPYFIAAADFNGDGKLDIVTGNLCTNCGNGPSKAISLLLGNGDGTFKLPINTELENGAPVYQVAIGDFNEDGKLDLAAADYYCARPICTGAMSVLLGNGDGTFQPSTDLVTYGGISSVTVADLNGDGHLDIAVPESKIYGQGGAGIFLGVGDGTFQPRADFIGKETSPFFMTVGDFNNDNKLDLAITNWGGLTALSSSVSLLLGNGDGTFRPGIEYPNGAAAQSLIVADFNRDGKLDLASSNYNDADVSVLIGSVLSASTSSLHFSTVVQIGTQSQPEAVKLTNVGAQTLHLNGFSITGTSAAYFKQTNDCGATLAPSASCTVDVTFAPRRSGMQTAGLTIADDSGQGQQTVVLNGIGSQVKLSTTSLSFGNQAVGTTSAPQTVTLTNLGGQMQFYRIDIGGMNSRDFAETHTCRQFLAAQSSCTITVTFTPKTTGARKGILEMHDSGGGTPQEVILTGTGT